MKRVLRFYFVLCLDPSHSLPDEEGPSGIFLLATVNEIEDVLTTLGCPFECGNRDLKQFECDEIPGETIRIFVESLEEEENIFWEKRGRYFKIKSGKLLTLLENRRKPKAPPKNPPPRTSSGKTKSDRITLDHIHQIEEHVRERLIGQHEAIDSVITHLRVEAAGLKRKRKPVYVAIFLGPTGVGKTELAYLLAEALHGSREDLLWIPCEDYSEEHTASTFLGSPPGYVGSEDRGRGVHGTAFYDKKTIETPYRVILFDELEKAHPVIHNHLLGIMHEGKALMRSGTLINFSKTIIIATANVGSEDLVKAVHGRSIGFTPPSEKGPKTEFDFPGKERKRIAREALKKAFRPEFLGRLDAIIIFRWLDPNEVKQILDLRIKEFNDELLYHEDGPFAVKLTEAARTFLAGEGFDPREGARRIDHIVDLHIRLTVSDLILNGKVKPGNEIVFDYKDGQLRITVVSLPVVQIPITDGKAKPSEENDEPKENV